MMKPLRLAAWLMLFAMSAGVAADAAAAPALPSAILAGSAPHGFTLVQGYGGGGGGDDDDVPVQHHSHPHYNNNRAGGGGGGAGIAAGLLVGGMILNGLMRQHQVEQRHNQIIQNQNLINQQRRNYLLQQQRQQQLRARQELLNKQRKDAARRDAIRKAQQDEQNRRANQRIENQRIENARREREIKKQQDEQAAKQQQELQELKEQNAANEQKLKQQEAIQKADEEQKENDEKYPSDQPPSPDDTHKAQLENGLNIIVTVRPHDNRPPIDDIPPLPVTQNTKLPACGYVNLPGEGGFCTGRTADGAWLRVVNVPAGATRRSVCVSYCTQKPVLPIIMPTRPKPRPAPVPVPEPCCATLPKPVPTPVPLPTPCCATLPNPVPTPEPCCATPPSGGGETKKEQHLTPAVETVTATETEQEEETRQLIPAVETVTAEETEQEEDKHPLTPAVETVTAQETEQEEEKHPLTPAVETVTAEETEQEEEKHPLTPAVETVTAEETEQEEAKHPLTPAVETVTAEESDEKETPQHLTPAVDTVTADSTEEKETPQHLTPAVDTVTAASTEEKESRPHLTPASLTVTAEETTEPGKKSPPAASGGELDEAGFCGAFYSCSHTQPITYHPPPPPPDENQPDGNGKGCTISGVKPLSASLAAPLLALKPDAPLSQMSDLASGVPTVGGVLSRALKLISPEVFAPADNRTLLEEMKKYVDDLVPAAIGQYDKDQLNNDLKTIRNDVTQYQNDQVPDTRGKDLRDLVKHIGDLEPRFFNPQSPRSTLAEFVAFSALRLAALKENYDRYDEYNAVDPTNAELVKKHAHDREGARQRLNAAIADAKAHMQTVRDDIINDRLSKLDINDRSVSTIPPSSGGGYFLGFMPFGGGGPGQRTAEEYSAKDDFCGWHGPEYRDNKGAANADVQNRKARIQAAYNKMLDELTNPVTSWKPL